MTQTYLLLPTLITRSLHAGLSSTRALLIMVFSTLTTRRALKVFCPAALPLVRTSCGCWAGACGGTRSARSAWTTIHSGRCFWNGAMPSGSESGSRTRQCGKIVGARYERPVSLVGGQVGYRGIGVWWGELASWRGFWVRQQGTLTEPRKTTVHKNYSKHVENELRNFPRSGGVRLTSSNENTMASESQKRLLIKGPIRPPKPEPWTQSSTQAPASKDSISVRKEKEVDEVTGESTLPFVPSESDIFPSPPHKLGL